MVRDGGTEAHQGWDLVATPMTPCYAVADGKVIRARFSPTYGNFIELEFRHGVRVFYAFYAHLAIKWAREGEQVRKGQLIGQTGNTGNASTMNGEDQHLHFEIRTVKNLSATGLTGRVDPGSLYGFTPQTLTIFEGPGRAKGGTGLKLRGVNVLGGKG